MKQDLSDKNNEYIRFDKNVAHFIDKIENTFAEDTLLVVRLLAYFAKSQQTNLFSTNILDPYDFAKSFGYSANYLRTKHHSPACLPKNPRLIEELYKEQELNPKDKDFRVLDSNLENALYLLLSRKMVYPRKAKFYTLDNGTEIKECSLESICFLKSFKTIWIKSKRGKEKIYYEYELEESFINNINHYFLNINVSYLTSAKYYRLYLYLSNLEYTFKLKHITKGESSFSFLCALAGINNSEPKQRKKQLNIAFDYMCVKRDLKVKLNWVKKENERWKYHPVIEFLDFKNENQDLHKEKINILFTNFMLEISKSFKELNNYYNYKDNAKLQLILFHYLKDCTYEVVKEFYYNAQIKTFKKNNDLTGELFKIFYRKLNSTNSWKDVKKLFNPKEKTFKESLKVKIQEIEKIAPNGEFIRDEILKILHQEYMTVKVFSSESKGAINQIKDRKSFEWFKIHNYHYLCKN